MRLKTRVLLLTAVLLPVIAFVSFRAWQHFPGQAKNEPEAPPPPALEIEPDASAATNLPSPRASEPLPPRDAPITDIAPLLQSRADAGDRKAACRLGIELMRCHLLLKVHQASVADWMQELELSQEAKGKPEDANRVAGLNLGYFEQSQLCASLPGDLVAQGPRYLRAAALAGEPEAMLRYADGQSLDTQSGFGFLRTPEFDQWRAEASTVLHAALAAGRPEAVELLRQAYAGDQGWMQGLVADDPMRAHAYFLLQGRLFNSPTAAPLPPPENLGADQLRDAEELAASLHERHFGGRRLDFKTSLHGLSPLYDPTGISGPAFRDHAYCEPPGTPDRG
jgi:hypothetical protein